MVFVPVVTCLLCLYRACARGPDRIGYARKAAAMGVGTALIVAPYLVRNELIHGSMMPISGALKSSFPRVSASGYAFSRMGPRDAASLLVVVAYLAWAAWERRGGKGNEAGGRRKGGGRRKDGGSRNNGARRKDSGRFGYFETAAAVLSAAVVLHFLHTVLFMKWAVFRWHYLSYSFVAVLALCVPAGRLFGRPLEGWRRAGYWACIALLITGGCFVCWRRYGGRSPGGWIIASYRAARWAREHIDAGDICAMKDAGNFGYFSGRRTISLDGVVNNAAYQETIRRRELNAYLAEMNVSYLVQHAFWNRDDIVSGTYDRFFATYTSQLYGTDSDTLSLGREWEVYRSEPYFDGPYRTVFIIWRLGGDRDAG